MQKTLRRAFITGLLIVLPLLVTFWVIHFIFTLIDDAVSPVVVHAIRLLGLGILDDRAWVDYVAPLVSVVLAVALICLVGLVGGNVFGRQLLQGLDFVLMQVPLVRSIYSSTRQFVETFSRASGQSFSRVVLVEYPRKGLWTVGLVTSSVRSEVQVRTVDEVIAVFLPTTPNPTSGWLVYVRESEVVPLRMSVDDAFKLVISGGILATPHRE